MTSEQHDEGSSHLEAWFREVEGLTPEDVREQKEDLKKQLSRVMRQMRVKALSLLEYAKGICQTEEARKLAATIEGRALSHGTIGDSPDELLADEAPFDGEIVRLERIVEEDMQSRNKPVRKEKTTLADLKAKQTALQDALRQLA